MDDIEIFQDGRAAFYGARTPAWHRLGTVTDDAVRAEHALRLAGLDNWDVTMRPVFTTGPDGQPVALPKHRATVRRTPGAPEGSFDALGVVGTDYQVIQNEEAFSFLTDLVEDGDATFETAGSLHGGARVFVTMRVPESVVVAGHDQIDLYLAVTTSHDGQSAFTAIPTPVRVVCQNTLTLALREARSRYRVQHRPGQAPSAAEARQMLGITMAGGLDIVAAAEEMLKNRVTDAEFDDIVAREFIPMPPHASPKQWENRMLDRKGLAYFFRDAPTQDLGRNTAWGAFNAISEWSEWSKPKNPAAPGSAESAITGDIAAVRQKAWNRFAPEQYKQRRRRARSTADMGRLDTLAGAAQRA
ncbi:DUF932 domain-containing protein [Georgenia muralis]|uniref:Phage/plasmid-like protein (TIGR03299 family) n=1 Tax=Georgenia muralis TaxID=154117 RepID=A0A3N4ZU64_9MICO|nr:DUF932 domain-containing protein [Georgenia muralis]RPF29032.1 phage/plasmid-like protein (TIGR03299 family) [Georgenia muralis]